jgi:hypothetical protein
MPQFLDKLAIGTRLISFPLSTLPQVLLFPKWE